MTSLFIPFHAHHQLHSGLISPGAHQLQHTIGSCPHEHQSLPGKITQNSHICQAQQIYWTEDTISCHGYGNLALLALHNSIGIIKTG